MAEDSFKEVILSCYDVGMDNIGLARGTARLGTYSISWPQLYEAEAKSIQEANQARAR